MRLIDRLERNLYDADDDQDDQASETAGDDGRSDSNSLFFDSGSRTEDEAQAEHAGSDNGTVASSEVVEEDAPAPGDGTSPVGVPTAVPQTRRTTSSRGPRPLKEGLRMGLSEERVWLQLQREELERERDELIAEIDAGIDEIDAKLGHIDALLGTDASETSDRVRDFSAAFPAPLQRTG